MTKKNIILITFLKKKVLILIAKDRFSILE